MNLVDAEIVEIVKPPYQKIDGDICCWAIDVKYNCWGSIRTETFTSISKKSLERYKVGYVFQM
jgi:hypothetical protein